MLEKMGHYVDVVENGQEAVDAFHHKDYDLIVMDSHMPVMEDIKRLKSSVFNQDPQANHHIILTADVCHEHISHVLKIGMNVLLTKPIDREELEEKISKIAQSPSNPML